MKVIKFKYYYKILNHLYSYSTLIGLGQDTCEGDSGGPLVVKSSNRKNSGDWTVAGIISYGYSCGDGTVVARVSSYYDWIIKIIENN